MFQENFLILHVPIVKGIKNKIIALVLQKGKNLNST